MTDRRTTRYPSCRGATGARLILDSSFFEWRGPLFEYLGSGSPQILTSPGVLAWRRDQKVVDEAVVNLSSAIR